MQAAKVEQDKSQNKYRLAKTLYDDFIKFLQATLSEELPEYSLFTTTKNERQVVFSNDCIAPIPVRVYKDKQVANSLVVKYLGMSDSDRKQAAGLQQPFHLFLISLPGDFYNIQLCKSVYDKPSSEEHAVDSAKLKLSSKADDYIKPILEFLNLVLIARQ